MAGQLLGAARHRLRKIVQFLGQILESGPHLAQPRHFDIRQQAQHSGFLHNGLLSLRQLRQPLQQRHLCDHRLQDSGGRLQPFPQEALRHQAQLFHFRQNLHHPLAFGALDQRSGRRQNLPHLPRQPFEIPRQSLDQALGIGHHSAQLSTQLAQSAGCNRFNRCHAPVLGHARSRAALTVAWTRGHTLPTLQSLLRMPVSSAKGGGA